MTEGKRRWIARRDRERKKEMRGWDWADSHVLPKSNRKSSGMWWRFSLVWNVKQRRRDGREGKYCNEKIGLGKENFILLCYPWILVILNFSISLPSWVVLCGEALGFSPGSFSVLLFRAVCGERHQQKERRRKYGIIWSGLKLFRFKHQNWI